MWTSQINPQEYPQILIIAGFPRLSEAGKNLSLIMKTLNQQNLLSVKKDKRDM